MKIKEKIKRGIGIKGKLISLFALFTGFVLLVVWFFQVLLLDVFYERIKIFELNKASTALSEVITDPEELEKAADIVLSDSMIFSKIYKIENETAHLVMSQDYIGNHFVQSATSEQLSKLFESAAKSKGAYYDRRYSPSASDPDKKNKELVYVQIVEAGEEIYIIILDMIYTPLDSMVNTLNLQFTWITGFLLVGALLFGGYMSYQFSTPLVRMTGSARKLAQGRYDADFSGEGFREARELADALNYASEELSKSDTMQKELIANISHDLRTPLTMISGYGEIMRDVPGENTSENIQVIIDESRRLSELVSDLLDLSKIQTETISFEKTKFNLTDAVRDILIRYNKLVENEGFIIDFEPEVDVFIEADRTRMLHVIYNLINNALNYSGEDKYVGVKLAQNGKKVRLSITDHGDGIAPEDIEIIWDRYYKVDRVHKRAVVGTGLGLSIVKAVLEAHGALYGVETALGYGSTFWFELDIV